MSATIVVRHKVSDFQKWKQFYEGADELHKRYGVMNAQVYRVADSPNEVVIVTEFKDMDSARGFGESAELKDAMMTSGVADQPSIYMTERIISKKFS